MHLFFYHVLEVTILAVKVIAYLVIVYSLLQNLYAILTSKTCRRRTFYRNKAMTDGIIGSLELLMVAEVLETMRAFEIRDIVATGLLMILRVFLTYTLQSEFGRLRRKPQTSEREAPSDAMFFDDESAEE